MEQLKKYLKPSKKDRPKKKSIHTSRHALAEEIAEYFNETKNYKKYLGVCHRYPEEKIRQLFAEIKQESRRSDKFSPVKKFFWKLKELE
ncbi:hypothetical protein KKB69_02375 [Patescibacteria group bacterium]|nr:hypothetical protein [Patescibacteria group bacterium]